jgi:UDP-N-acetylmuramate--alanine ligase
VMFQPHTYSRTRALLADFAACFAEAYHVIVVDIFRSRETPDGTISAADIVKRMKDVEARHIPALEDAADYLCAHLQTGDVLLTLGAGNGDWVGLKVLEVLESRQL